MKTWTRTEIAGSLLAIAMMVGLLTYLMRQQPQEAIDELAEQIARDEQRAKDHIASFPDFVPASKGKQHDDDRTANGWIWSE